MCGARSVRADRGEEGRPVGILRARSGSKCGSSAKDCTECRTPKSAAWSRPRAETVAGCYASRGCAFRPPGSRVSCDRSDAVVVRASDRFLVAAAQAGDLQAFEALVCRHQSAVYRVALRMLGSEVDAEDAAQEALVRAWRALSTFRGESAFSTWLYRIVINRCLKARAARRPMEALPDVLIDLGSDPAEAVAQSERLRALARGVLVLPAEQRAALVLRELEGLSYEQIAQVLGVTVPAVKGRIHRARLGLLKASATWH